jgi:Ca2+:H+ antiporter
MRRFGSSLNWLLLLLPVAILLERARPESYALVFFSACLAILPLAGLIVRATAQIASRTGDTIGGLLDATFGDAPEVIITLVALRAGYLDMVRASPVDAIVANFLLALGVAFLLGACVVATSSSTRPRRAPTAP